MWAGTGEAWVIRDSDIGGDGIYKSTDAGKTWKNVGLPEAGRIGRIIVHPTNPNIVYACVIGRVTAPQQERGVYRTLDGGATWERSLFVDPNTGCSGISMDPNHPGVLIAGMWQVELHTWAMFSGGPGSGVYRTLDGGNTWTKATTGMPRSPVGKIDVAIAASNPQRMYALIQTANQGSLWRSEDGGATWKTVSWDRTLIGRAGYYISMKVNPQNPDDLFILNSGFHRSSDGGVTFGGGGGGGGGCGDCHDVWIDPKDGRRFVLTDDGGARISSPTGSQSVSLPIGQMYHVGTDNRMPYWIYSNRQDDGTMRGPSNSPVTVANVPSYVARSAVPSGGGGAPGGGRGRGGGGAGGGAGARGGAPARLVRRAQRAQVRLAGRRLLQRARPRTRARSLRRTQACSRAAVAAAGAAARRRSGRAGSADANPDSRCRCRAIRTSSGRRATATKSRATTRTSDARDRCRRGFTRSTPSRRSSSTAVTGRRRSSSIRSRKRRSITAATSSSRRRTRDRRGR